MGRVTRYGLNGPGIKSRWGRVFPHPSRPALGRAQPPVEWVPNHSRGKWLGHGVDHPSPYSAEVKERVQLYAYFPSVPSWQVIGWNLSFYIITTVFEGLKITTLNRYTIIMGLGCTSISDRWFITFISIQVVIAVVVDLQRGADLIQSSLCILRKM